MHLTVPGALIPLYLSVTRANQPFVTADGARQRIRERFERPVSFAPPRRLEGVAVQRRLPDPLGWPVYDVVPGTVGGRPSAPGGVVVYLHGGGWVHEIAPQHWRLIARIARETGHREVVPIHPLLPRGTVRPVRDGVLALMQEELAAGHTVRLAGDSSGGQIVLSAALQLRDEGTVLPATTLLSPALDLTWRNPRIDAVQPYDPWLARPGGAVLADAWRGTDSFEDPLVSPLFGDMAGLGPLTILTGTHDVLNPDAHLLRDKATAAGVEVTWHEEAGQVHVYALLPTAVGDRGARALMESLSAP